jgi:long-chain acyl-CoA synthetase
MSTEPWLNKYPPGVDWNAEIPAQPLYALIDDAVHRYPNNPCIDFLGRKFTYANIGRQIDHAAAGFQKLGVGKGIKVGLFLPNCPQFVIAYYGVLKAGGTVVNYSPLYSEPEILHQVEDSQTDIMVTLNLKVLYPKMAAMLRQSRIRHLVVGTLPDVLPFPKNLLYPLAKSKDVAKVPNDRNHSSFRELLNNDGTYQLAAVDLERDVAVLQYTGGTTGVSKGAMLTHANLYINAVQAAMWSTIVEPGQERVLGVLPFFHVFAMTVVLNQAILIGAEIIMHPRFELAAALKDIDGKKPSLMPGVPTMFAAINNYPQLADFDLSSLKACISGGAPLPLEVKQRFEERSGCKVFEGYGLTETSPVATANPMDGENKENSIGLPVPRTRIVITDREDPHRVLALGETGEICIEGPQVMAGYWRNEEATAATIVDSRLHTGDVGYMDEDGYTFIIDRMKDLILTGGFNVYPRNVEEAIYQHTAVAECTVIGVPDDYYGQSVKAFVKLGDGDSLTAGQLLDFLRDKLGKHELPKHVEFRKELPKTMIGKLSKKELVAEEMEKYQLAKVAE